MPTVISCEGKNFDCVNGFEGEVSIVMITRTTQSN